MPTSSSPAGGGGGGDPSRIFATPQPTELIQTNNPPKASTYDQDFPPLSSSSPENKKKKDHGDKEAPLQKRQKTKGKGPRCCSCTLNQACVSLTPHRPGSVACDCLIEKRHCVNCLCGKNCRNKAASLPADDLLCHDIAPAPPTTDPPTPTPAPPAASTATTTAIVTTTGAAAAPAAATTPTAPTGPLL